MNETSNVFRKERIYGTYIASMIHNDDYHWHDMDVYTDGVISCWERVEYSKIKDKIDSGWLEFHVPIGKTLSIFNLCSLEILEAKWNYDNVSFYEHINDTLKKINPEMANIYKSTKLEQEYFNEKRIWRCADGELFLNIEGKGRFSTPEQLHGEKCNIFYKKDDKYILTLLEVYTEGVIKIDCVRKESFQLEDIKKLFTEGILTVNVPFNNWIVLGDLGEVKAKYKYSIPNEEKIIMITDMVNQSFGKKSLQEICMKCYYQYLIYTDDYSRLALKKAYEDIPASQRRYLGDMDSKDYDFKRIIYHPERKREV